MLHRRAFGWKVRLLLATGLLASAGLAQVAVNAPGPTRAAPPSWPTMRFDLSRLAIAPDTGVRDTTAGGDAVVAPGLVAGLGAADRQRGAAAAPDAVTPLFQRQAQVSGRLGLLVGEHGLLFGRLGYSEFDVNEAFSRFGSRGFSTGGVLVGAGAEARLSPTLSLTTEYHSVDYRPSLSDRQLLGGLAWHY